MQHIFSYSFYFFFNDTATTEIYTLSLHDALPIYPVPDRPTPRLDEAERMAARGQGRQRGARRPVGRARHRSADEPRRLTDLVHAHHRPRQHVAGLVDRGAPPELAGGGEGRAPPAGA